MLDELILWILGFGAALVVAVLSYLLNSINQSIMNVQRGVDVVCKRLSAVDSRISAVDRRVAFIEGSKARSDPSLDYELRSNR